MFLMRLLIVGDTGVGKTSLLVRFNENNFVNNQKTTIGVDYKAKEITIDNECVKLQIWDTAGQERFRSMTSAFYNKAQGVVVTFDVTQYDSFLSLPTWIRDINQNSPSGCVIILCATKADVSPDLWKIRREEFQAFAKDNNFQIFETSASAGLNVQEVFIELGRQILAKNRDQLAKINDSQGENMVLFDAPSRVDRKKRKGCCVI